MSKCTAAQAVAAMEYWDGYYEKASSKYVTRRDKDVFTLDKGSANYTYPGYYCGIQGGAWCAMLVSTALAEACGSKTDAKSLMYGVWPYASCNQLYDAAPSGRKGRRGSWQPLPGDVIVFSSNGSTREHTGMVIKVTASYVYTQEGNASNKCQQKKYAKTNSYIYGYVRPDYADAGEQTVTVTLKMLKYGSTGDQVKTVQLILKGLGYTVGAVDGEFGSKTSRAVSDFQKDYGLTVDSVVGANTWKKLLGC